MEQHLNNIKGAVELGLKAGAYGLSDATNIIASIIAIEEALKPKAELAK